jgi:hypothetical protein
MTKKKDPGHPENERDRHKLEIADELGFGDKLRREGWGGLTSKETGEIGARIGIKRREEINKKD